MSIDIRKRGAPTTFQDHLGREVYETAGRGAIMPAWSSLSQARRWRWIWAGESAVAMARATSSVPVPEQEPPVASRPAVVRPAGTAPMQLHENWGAQIRKRRQARQP